MPANTDHRSLVQPLDPLIPIWRYMDLPKYVALLQARGLFFSRIDALGDPFEGSLSRKEYEKRQSHAKAQEDEGSLPVEFRGQYFDVLMNATRRAQLEHYAICWHMNVSESEAMWRLYGASNSAIAIKTSYEKLAMLLPKMDGHIGPFLGVVQYKDFDMEDFPANNSLGIHMHKRSSFLYEQECRAIYWRQSKNDLDLKAGRKVIDEIRRRNPVGVSAALDLRELISKVVISPLAPKWFSKVVEDITRKYDYGFPVEQSTISSSPYI